MAFGINFEATSMIGVLALFMFFFWAVSKFGGHHGQEESEMKELKRMQKETKREQKLERDEAKKAKQVEKDLKKSGATTHETDEAKMLQREDVSMKTKERIINNLEREAPSETKELEEIREDLKEEEKIAEKKKQQAKHIIKEETIEEG